MDLQLAGKRALISGGSRGIGLAIGRALVGEGARVGLVARGAEVAEIASNLTAQSGGEVIGLQADTADDDSVRSMVATAIERLGGVDILVNTAAVPWTSDQNVAAVETSDDLVRAHFEVKVLGYLRTARAVAPHMIDNGWGRIINISGLGARSAGSVTQTIRNIGVSALTKNLADELGPYGINVTVVHPGLTRTERLTAQLQERARSEGSTVAELESQLATNSSRHLVDASEVADVVAFLASPRSIAINGDAIAVGGGAPGPVYY